MLMLDGYHVVVIHVQGNLILRGIEDNISKSNIDTKVKIDCVFNGLSQGRNLFLIINCIDSKKQHKATNYNIHFHTKHDNIRNIALNFDRYISDKDCGTISTIEKNEKN